MKKRVFRAGWWSFMTMAGALVILSSVIPYVYPQSASHETYEQEMLKFLGIKRPPTHIDKPSGKISTYMQQLYKNKQIFEVGSHYDNADGPTTYRPYPSAPDTVRSIANITEVGNVTEVRNGVYQIRIKFSMDGLSSEERLHSAQLRVTHSPKIYEESEELHQNSVLGDFRDLVPQKYKKEQLPYVNYVRVYDVVRVLDDGDTVQRLLDIALVDRRESGVMTLDVGAAVERWAKRAHTNHGLVLEMDPYNGHGTSATHKSDISHLRVRRETDFGVDEWHSYKPAVVVFTDDGKPKTRVKRDKPSGSEAKCSRQSLYVDFKLVKWANWIVAPFGYHAYFCDGECRYPLADHLNATNHAIIQTLVKSGYPNSNVPEPCCIPTELSAIAMLYHDEYSNVVLKNYLNMVVEACGCR